MPARVSATLHVPLPTVNSVENPLKLILKKDAFINSENRALFKVLFPHKLGGIICGIFSEIFGGQLNCHTVI